MNPKTLVGLGSLGNFDIAPPTGIVALMQALSGPDWQKRNEPILDIVRGADVIIGTDTVRNVSWVFFGKSELSAIVSNNRGKHLTVLTFEIDTEATDPDQVAFLSAAVDVLRGHHDCDLLE